MRELLKYELKGTRKLFLYSCAGLILIFIISFILYKSSWFAGTNKNLPIVFGVMFEIMIVSAFSILGVERLRRDLYSESGYLLLTIPINGYSIVGAKLVASVIEFILISALSAFIILIQAVTTTTSNKPVNLLDISLKVPTIIVKLLQNSPGIMLLCSTGILVVVSFTLIGYLASILSKSILLKKKAADFFIGIAVCGLFVLYLWLNYRISRIFPQTIDIDVLKIGGFTFNVTQLGDVKINILASEGNEGVNIASYLFGILVPVGLFFATGYLLDKKVEV